MNRIRPLAIVVALLALGAGACGGATSTTRLPTGAPSTADQSAPTAGTPSAPAPAPVTSGAGQGEANGPRDAAIFVRVTGDDGMPAVDAFSSATGALLAQTPLGIPTPDWSVVYVATASGTQTGIRALDPLTGRETAATTVDGSWAVPAAMPGAPSDGLARDAGLIVLVDQAPPAGRSRFALVPTSFAAAPRILTFDGLFTFDAIAPNARYVYFIQQIGAPGDGHYQVRAYDASAQQLLQDPIVDKREIGELMEGQPIARATSANGAWAYTVYVKDDGTAFVHELDTLDAFAFCGDLPEDLEASTAEDRAAWRIGIAGNSLPYVANGRLGIVGLVENDAVQRVKELGRASLHGESEIVVADGTNRVFLAGPAGLTVFDSMRFEPVGSATALARGATGGALLTPDGATLLTGSFSSTGGSIQRFAIGSGEPTAMPDLSLALVDGLEGARLIGVSSGAAST